MKSPTPWLALLFGFSCAVAYGDSSENPPSEISESSTESSTVEFNRDVRPILAEYCFACHGTDEESRAADLRLDIREDAIDAGAITPHEVDASELIARLHSEDEDSVMPPPETKKTLSDDDKATLERWIAEGAPYQRHWSLVPPVKTPPVSSQPSAENQNPIDAYVTARLANESLEPAPQADPAALFRRLHLDITGLPPAPDQVVAFTQAFAKDADRAVEDAIDRLMESPAWGEHRARYWLDAARYADTHGMHFDNYREMWPYRDWVIRSFNRNQPFDEFYTEQLAGDLLPQRTDDQLIATGFLRCNMTTNEGGTIDEENLAIYAADRVQTFGWVFLGLTANCAQCHDHKFDQFSTRDYYSLAAYFRNIDHPAKDGNHKTGRSPTMMVPSESDARRLKELESEIADAESQFQTVQTEARDRAAEWTSVTSASDLDVLAGADESAIAVSLDLSLGQMVSGSAAHSAKLIPRGKPSFASLREPNAGNVSAAVISKKDTFEVSGVEDFELDRPFSVSMWVRPDDHWSEKSILSKLDSDDQSKGWEVKLGRQRLDLYLVDRLPDRLIHVKSRREVCSQNQWTHFAFTYDGSGDASGISLVVNGELEILDIVKNRIGSGAAISNRAPLRIGARPGASGFFGKARRLQLAHQVEPTWKYQLISKLPSVREAMLAEEASDEQKSLIEDFYVACVDTEARAVGTKLSQLRIEQTTINSRSPITHVAQELDRTPMTPILMRGEYDAKGEEVVAAPPEALHPMPEGAPNNRLGLAQWLVDPKNPLTARVTVNRFWQEIFGRGIVPTPDDFGVTGTLPSHPELLDHLAIDFIESGWDVKAWFKKVLMSQTYRQSAVATADKIEKDPSNAWLSRGPRFRMDAEMIRDSALTVSGLLSDQMYGPGVKPYQPNDIWNIVGLGGGDTRDYVRDPGEGSHRRTLYSFWKRMAPPPNMETFGAPNRENCVVKRERTNTPLQALVTLNDEQFVEAARALATRALGKSGQADTDDVIDTLARRLLSRDFQPAERALVDESYHAYLDHYRSSPDDVKQLLSIGDFETPNQIDPPQLAAWTMVCNQLMNLDEVLCK